MQKQRMFKCRTEEKKASENVKTSDKSGCFGANTKCNARSDIMVLRLK
jgi:hypothetical protein